MSDIESNTLLSVNELDVTFKNKGREVHAVKKITFNIEKGQSLGIVGESGSGKSVTSLSLLDLYRNNNNVRTKGEVKLGIDNEIVSIRDIDISSLLKIRGRRLSIVLQEPASVLNPVRKCGKHLEEILKIQSSIPKSKYRNEILSAFTKVALTDIERVYDSYPHELSGGQIQRVCIAMAIICNPILLICDEATSSLDVTVQKEIIELLKKLRNENNLSLLFISHDLDVVRELCDRILIMKDGEIVESGLTSQIFTNPRESYTKQLLNNKPSLRVRSGQTNHKVSNERVLILNKLTHRYPRKNGSIFQKKRYDVVVDNVSFDLHKSEIIGIVGESGSGKTTIAKAILGMISYSEGTIEYIYQDKWIKIADAPRRDIQLVFQDPYSSLNPAMSIGSSLYELISYHRLCPKAEIKHRVSILLEQVGLSDAYYDRLPRELSGGQRQRVCIAKAIAVEPRILVCDECVSALDVTVQSQILDLLLSLRQDLGLSIIFISHDLAVINTICDHIIVMHDGKMVESGSTNEIIQSPQMSYTKRLLSSVPGQGINI